MTNKDKVRELYERFKQKQEKRKQPVTSLDDLKYLFDKSCTNAYPAEQYENNKRVPMSYRRDDLSRWAEEAFNNGKAYFYAEPVNPKDPCGRLRLTEPKYVYKLCRNLTEEEFQTLFGSEN